MMLVLLLLSLANILLGLIAKALFPTVVGAFGLFLWVIARYFENLDL